MKGFLPPGWLFLIVSVMWTSSVGQKVHVHCGPWWIQVRINAIIFDKLFAQPDELFLGEECPVTKELGDSYEFFYILPQCDIETTILPGNILQHKTKIKYISTSSENQIDIPVSCLSSIQVPPEVIQRKEDFLKHAFNLISKGRKILQA